MAGSCPSGDIELFGLTVHDQLTERQASTRPLGREGARAPRSWAIARVTSASPARKLSLQCLDLLAEPGHAGPIRRQVTVDSARPTVPSTSRPQVADPHNGGRMSENPSARPGTVPPTASQALGRVP